MSEATERKDFPEWAVTAVYLAQDGICKNCGGSLDRGFHRHHVDGNRSNNSVDNCNLICADCHRATFAGAGWKEHKEQEKRVLEKLNEVIDLTMKKEVPGSSLERLLEAMVMSLKTSRSINQLDKGIEYPPPSIMAFKRFNESKVIQGSIIDGFKEGIEVGTNLVRNESYKQGWKDAIQRLQNDSTVKELREKYGIGKTNNASSVESKVTS